MSGENETLKTLVVDVEKLNQLKSKIEEQEDRILAQISEALKNDDESTFNVLKQRQLQCTAELRLIQHIENNFKGDFMIY